MKKVVEEAIKRGSARTKEIETTNKSRQTGREARTCGNGQVRVLGRGLTGKDHANHDGNPGEEKMSKKKIRRTRHRRP